VIDELAAAILSVALLLYGVVARPTRFRCPRGWYIADGVRTDDHFLGPRGSFACRRPPIGGDDDVMTGRNTAVERPGAVRLCVYCIGGFVLIVIDERTVGCQAKH
jgi:hypothetical protein